MGGGGSYLSYYAVLILRGLVCVCVCVSTFGARGRDGKKALRVGKKEEEEEWRSGYRHVRASSDHRPL